MRKIVSLSLAALLLITLFAGCSPQADSLELIEVPSTEITDSASQAFDKIEIPTATTGPHFEATEETAQNSSTEAQEETSTSETNAPSCQHSYKFKVTKEPDCTHSGERLYTCTICGASYKETIAPLEHSFVITTTAPDCTNSGYTTHHCKVCGYTYTDNQQPARGHDYGPWIITRAPTEFETGLAVCTCLRCGTSCTMTLPRLSTDSASGIE